MKRAVVVLPGILGFPLNTQEESTEAVARDAEVVALRGDAEVAALRGDVEAEDAGRVANNILSSAVTI